MESSFVGQYLLNDINERDPRLCQTVEDAQSKAETWSINEGRLVIAEIIMEGHIQRLCWTGMHPVDRGVPLHGAPWDAYQKRRLAEVAHRHGLGAISRIAKDMQRSENSIIAQLFRQLRAGANA